MFHVHVLIFLCANCAFCASITSMFVCLDYYMYNPQSIWKRVLYHYRPGPQADAALAIVLLFWEENYIENLNRLKKKLNKRKLHSNNMRNWSRLPTWLDKVKEKGPIIYYYLFISAVFHTAMLFWVPETVFFVGNVITLGHLQEHRRCMLHYRQMLFLNPPRAPTRRATRRRTSI